MFLGFAKFLFSLVSIAYSFLLQIPLFSFHFAEPNITKFYYTPSIIWVFILAKIFNYNYALLALSGVCVLGLCGFNIFSFGGGWQYIFEPSFGYIIAMFFIAFAIFDITMREKQNQESYFVQQIIVLFGVNVFAILYFLLFNKFAFIPLQELIYQLLYDLIFAIMFLWLFKKKH